MSKKEYILKVLDKLWSDRDRTEEIKRELVNDNLTDDYIDYLYEQFTKIVEEINKKQNSDTISKMKDYLNNIKDLETKSKEADAEDIKKLEDLMNQF